MFNSFRGKRRWIGNDGCLVYIKKTAIAIDASVTEPISSLLLETLDDEVPLVVLFVSILGKVLGNIVYKSEPEQFLKATATGDNASTHDELVIFSKLLQTLVASGFVTKLLIVE